MNAWHSLELTILLQVTAITLGAAIAMGTAHRRAALRHAIGVVALALVLVSPALAVLLPRAAWFGNVASGAALDRPAADRDDESPIATGAIVAQPNISTEDTNQPPATTGPGTPSSHASAPAASDRADWLARGFALASSVWAAGALILCLRFVAVRRRLRVFAGSIEPASIDLAVVAEARRALAIERLPPVGVSDLAPMPLVLGCWRPRVVLPRRLFETGSAARLRDVLIHESAHILRCDPWINLAQHVAGAVFWPHPGVHWLGRQIARSREEVCDNFVLAGANSADYAQTLLELAEQCAGPRFALSLLGMFSRRWSLEERISGILSPDRTKATRAGRLPLAAAALLLAVACALVGGAGALAQVARQPNAAQAPVTTTEAVSSPEPEVTKSQSEPTKDNRERLPAGMPAEVVRVPGKPGLVMRPVAMAEVTLTPLELLGTLVIDPPRLARVHSQFAGDVTAIGKVRDERAPAPDVNAERDLRPGDRVAKGQLLAVVWSKELGEKKSDLADALVAKHFSELKLKQLLKLDAGKAEAESDVDIRFAREAWDAAHFEYEKKKEATSKVPGSVSAVDLKRAELAEAKAKLDIEKAIVDHQRLISAGTVPQSRLDEVRHQVELDDAAAQKVERTLLAWRVPDEDIDRIRHEVEMPRDPNKTSPKLGETWSQFEIRAPLAGVILEKNATIGDFVDPTFDLFKIADLTKLTVVATVAQNDIAAIQALHLERRRWTIRPKDSTPPISGFFDTVSETIDPSTGAGKVTGSVDNRDGILRAGQSLTVSIVDPAIYPSTLQIPLAAIVNVGPWIGKVWVEVDAAKPTFEWRQVNYSKGSTERVSCSLVPPIPDPTHVLRAGARVVIWSDPQPEKIETPEADAQSTTTDALVSGKINVATIQPKAVTFSQRYVCQIHSQRHIKLRALDAGHLEAITIKEGQQVKKGDLLFKIIPSHYQKRVDAKNEDEAVSIKAPFDGLVGRLLLQQGSLVEEGEILSTLSDNSVMWVYFNVPEARYLEHMANLKEHPEEIKIELVLANGNKFDQLGKLATIEAHFNNENGNIPFRADFPNPDRLLRHGQTGTVVISRPRKDAIVIPQRATFEVLQKRYVYVVDEDHVAHQREIAYEEGEGLDDLFIIKQGVGAGDKIVVEGIRQVRDGDKVEYDDRQSKTAVAN